MDERIISLLEGLNFRFQEFEKRVEKRLDEIQTQLNRVDWRVGELNTMVRTLAKQYGDLSLDVAVLRERDRDVKQ